MPALHIREVDDATLQRLKLRAKANHRSLQGEVRAILQDVSLSEQTIPRRLRTLKIHRVAIGAKANYSRQEIYGDESD